MNLGDSGEGAQPRLIDGNLSIISVSETPFRIIAHGRSERSLSLRKLEGFRLGPKSEAVILTWETPSSGDLENPVSCS
jgi:hypothetical protein